jgi:rhodanese-related sulfurtransferase
MTFGYASEAKKKEKIDILFDKYRPKFSKVKNIEVETFLSLPNKENTILIDVREKTETDISIIPGAILLDQFLKNKNKFKDKTLVFYCTLGVRSGLKAQDLQKEGFNVLNLKGSILSWAHAGLEFDHKGTKTKKVHTYGKDWHLLPEGYEAIY